MPGIDFPTQAAIVAVLAQRALAGQSAGGSSGGGASVPDYAMVLDAQGEWAVQGPGNTATPDGYLVTDAQGDLAIDTGVSSGYTISAIGTDDYTVEVP